MPSVADVRSIATFLECLVPGRPLTHGALTVVPLLAGNAPDPGWLTLAESETAVAITEVSEAGQVSALGLTNGADRPVLILAGQELLGAKQNRVLNTTVLVEAGARLTLPVSCVEQGRWSARSRRFAPTDTSLFSSARGRMAAQVSDSLRRGAGHRSDQAAVWSDVATFGAALRVESPTGAMHDAYDRYADDLAAARQALAARPGQVGALVYLAGARGRESWIGLDLLPAPRLFAAVWPGLCAGYVAEALGHAAAGGARWPAGGRDTRQAAGSTSRRADSPSGAGGGTAGGVGSGAAGDAGQLPRVPAAEILDLLRRAPAEEAPAVGLGTELRFAGAWLQGAVLVAAGLPAHLMAFPSAA